MTCGTCSRNVSAAAPKPTGGNVIGSEGMGSPEPYIDPRFKGKPRRNLMERLGDTIGLVNRSNVATETMNGDQTEIVKNILTDGPLKVDEVENKVALESLVSSGIVQEVYYPNKGFSAAISMESHEDVVPVLGTISQESLLDIFSRSLNESFVEKIQKESAKAKEVLNAATKQGPGNIYSRNQQVLSYLMKNNQMVNDVTSALRDEANNFNTAARILGTAISDMNSIAGANDAESVMKIIEATSLTRDAESVSKMKFMKNMKIELRDGQAEGSVSEKTLDENGKPIEITSNSKIVSKVVIGSFYLGPLSTFFGVNKLRNKISDDKKLDEIGKKLNVDLGQLKQVLTVDVKAGDKIIEQFQKLIPAVGNASAKMKSLKLDRVQKEAAKNYMAMVKSLGLLFGDAVKHNCAFIVSIAPKLT